MVSNIHIFSRHTKRLQRGRALKNLERHDFLYREVADRMAELFSETVTAQFPLAVELGSRNGYLQKALSGLAGIHTYLPCETTENTSGVSLVLDEEWLPFKENSVPLFLSLLNLHWVNDLPGCLVQIRKALADKGLMVATMLGGQTLWELKAAIAEAASETGTALTPRISPFVEIKDAGMLLQRTGFNLPVADSDTITVMYPDAMALMYDLRGMGESNALVQRQKSFTAPGTLEAINAAYKKLFQTKEGRVPATFEVITLTGWKS